MRTEAEILDALRCVDNIADVARATGLNQNHLYKMRGTASRGLSYDEGRRLSLYFWPPSSGDAALAWADAEAVREQALADANAAVAVLLELNAMAPADSSLLLRLFPAIAKALEAAREAGDDPQGSARAVARHLWRLPSPEVPPQ